MPSQTGFHCAVDGNASGTPNTISRIVTIAGMARKMSQ